jgi:hypothetical protein
VRTLPRRRFEFSRDVAEDDFRTARLGLLIDDPLAAIGSGLQLGEDHIALLTQHRPGNGAALLEEDCFTVPGFTEHGSA